MIVVLLLLKFSFFIELILEQAWGKTIDNLDYWGITKRSDLIDLENNFVDTAQDGISTMEIIYRINPNVEKTQSKQVNSVGEMGNMYFL